MAWSQFCQGRWELQQHGYLDCCGCACSFAELLCEATWSRFDESLSTAAAAAAADAAAAAAASAAAAAAAIEAQLSCCKYTLIYIWHKPSQTMPVVM